MVLQEELKRITGVRIPIVSPGLAPSEEGLILLGTSGDSELVRSLLTRAGVRLNRQGRIRDLAAKVNGDQGFAIQFGRADGRSYAVIAGNTPRGVFYGAQTFCDRVHRSGKGTFAVDCHGELAAPAFEHRSFFGLQGSCCYVTGRLFEETFSRRDGTIDTQAFIRWVTRYRVNNLLLGTLDLNFGVGLRSPRLARLVNPHHSNVRHEFLHELVTQAHRNHISVYLYAEFPDRYLGILHHRPDLAWANGPDLIRNNLSQRWWRRFYQGHIRADHSSGALADHQGILDIDKPATMRFWKAYWRDLLSTYPEVDGIGVEICEHLERHPRAGDFLARMWDYMKAMTDVAEQVRPGLDFFVYDSRGTPVIAAQRDQLPNLTYIRWGHYASREPVARVHGTHPDWYLTHGYYDSDYEPWLRRHCQAALRLGYRGIQKRLAKYDECARVYFALSQFGWSPKMTWREFAERYVLRTHRVKDPRRACAYAEDLRMRSARAAAQARRQHG